MEIINLPAFPKMSASPTKLSNFPLPIVTFGKSCTNTSLEILQENTAKLNSLSQIMFTGLEHGAKYATVLATPAMFAVGYGPLITILFDLAGEVDKLHKELKNLEEKMFSKFLEGKIQALNFHLENLRDEQTSEMQKVSEVVTALSHLNEILPVFSDKDSIFREKYHEGAPLFAHFCSILKAICLIGEGLPSYNTSHLHVKKKRYQDMLDWYRIRTIGRRMASCYVIPMLAARGVEWIHDWERHFLNYKEYYEGSTSFAWMTYGENLGGVGWRVWSSPVKYCSIVDTWDTRPHEEVTFIPLEVQQSSMLNHKRRRNVLAEYRRQVHDVMTKFFEDVSPIPKVSSNGVEGTSACTMQKEMEKLSL